MHHVLLFDSLQTNYDLLQDNVSLSFLQVAAASFKETLKVSTIAVLQD